MKQKSVLFCLAISIILMFSSSCGTMNYTELRTMQDRTFYLDKFETSTLEMLLNFDLTEEDTKKLQNHYAENIPIGKIKTLLEKKLNIKIDSAEFEEAVKQGPITENKNSISEKNYGIRFARWKAPDADKHKNQVIIYFQCLTQKYHGYSRECPLYIYTFYLVVDGKFVTIEYDRYSTLGFSGEYPNCRVSEDKWIDYYAGCIKDMYNSIENKVYTMKK